VVFERTTGKIVAPGANLVVAQRSSLLHAELVAIAIAQARLQNFTLAAGSYELVTSSEPCVQCLGVLFWSGIESLICGAAVDAAEAAGFDEGPRAADWKEQLARRGIAVEDHVLEERARAALVEYQRRGGIVYNARNPRARNSP
jgi:tRNA(Arg) A34 adenosine deaminase TadA